MSCCSYQYRYDGSEVCYKQPYEESPQGYRCCFCQGDIDYCPLSDFNDEEVGEH